MDEYMKISHKRNSFKNSSKEDKMIKYLRGLITRVLLSIIFVISTSIFIKLNASNKLYVEDYIFQDSLKFTQINKWYQDNFGKILPEVNNNEELVFSSNDFYNNSYEKIGSSFLLCSSDVHLPTSRLSGARRRRLHL